MKTRNTKETNNNETKNDLLKKHFNVRKIVVIINII